jgi:hypothetical protein
MNAGHHMEKSYIGVTVQWIDKVKKGQMVSLNNLYFAN